MTKKTVEQIIQESMEEVKNACINIKKNLQANEILLLDSVIMSLAEKFYDEMKKQNSKVIITGDGK